MADLFRDLVAHTWGVPVTAGSLSPGIADAEIDRVLAATRDALDAIPPECARRAADPVLSELRLRLER